MAKLLFLFVLAFVAYVAAYPSPHNSVIQSLPGRVKRAASPYPDPEHLHHYETTTRDRFGNVKYTHEDVVHPDPYDFYQSGFYDDHQHHHYGHHHHYPHYGGHGLLGGFLDVFG